MIRSFLRVLLGFGIVVPVIIMAQSLLVGQISKQAPPEVQEKNASAVTNKTTLAEKVACADLIIVGRIKRSVGSKLKDCQFAEPKVLFGKIAPGKELVVVLRESALLYSTNRNNNWIVFASKPYAQLPEARYIDGSFEYRDLIGDRWDTNGMVLATEENIVKVKSLISKRESP